MDFFFKEYTHTHTHTHHLGTTHDKSLTWISVFTASFSLVLTEKATSVFSEKKEIKKKEGKKERKKQTNKGTKGRKEQKEGRKEGKESKLASCLDSKIIVCLKQGSYQFQYFSSPSLGSVKSHALCISFS